MGRAAVVTVERHYRYVYEDESRHGQIRVYFWRGPGHRKVRIRERIGTPEFDRRHADLLDQGAAGAFKAKPLGAPIPHTLRWLCHLYMQSAECGQLDPRTRHVTKLILDSIYAEPIVPGAKEVFGDCPLPEFTAKSVTVLRDRKAAAPEAANSRIRRLRSVFKWALLPANADLGITTNPARDVAYLKPKRAGGFPAWRPEDLDKFEACHPIGSKARLALALLIFVGARRSDVVRLGRAMEQDGVGRDGKPIRVLSFVPHKGRNKADPVEVNMPIIPDLRAVIDGTPVVGRTTYLVTQYGRPFTAESFGNKMAHWCRLAGLAGKNSHGVRKAAARRAAERGASTKTLMALFGWLDIKQAERYTRDASRKKLAAENAHLLGTEGDRTGTDSGQNFPTSEADCSQVGKTA
jgi:integrase